MYILIKFVHYHLSSSICYAANNTTSRPYHYSVLKMLRDISPKLNLPTQGALKLLHLIGQRA